MKGRPPSTVLLSTCSQAHPPRPPLPRQTKKILQACDKSPTDNTKVEYDEHNPFKVCGKSKVPIYKGKPSVSGPLRPCHLAVAPLSCVSCSPV